MERKNKTQEHKDQHKGWFLIFKQMECIDPKTLLELIAENFYFLIFYLIQQIL